MWRSIASIWPKAPAPLNANPAFGQVDVVRMTYVAPTDARAREESEEPASPAT